VGQIGARQILVAVLSQKNCWGGRTKYETLDDRGGAQNDKANAQVIQEENRRAAKANRGNNTWPKRRGGNRMNHHWGMVDYQERKKIQKLGKYEKCRVMMVKREGAAYGADETQSLRAYIIYGRYWVQRNIQVLRGERRNELSQRTTPVGTAKRGGGSCVTKEHKITVGKASGKRGGGKWDLEKAGVGQGEGVSDLEFQKQPRVQEKKKR